MEDGNVSVILPAHADAPYLDLAIKSVLADLSEPDELILVDDRLSDAGRQVVSSICDPRLRVIPCNGAGLVDALNTGLRSARHQYVARMDADDISLAGRFRAQRAVLASYPALLAIGGQLRLIDSSGNAIGQRNYPVDPLQIARQLRYQNVLGHPAVMFRRDSVLSLGGYRSEFPAAEDYDLWLRLSELGYLANLEQDVLAYRVHGAQVTRDAATLVAESTYLAQWAARRRMRNCVEFPLPWRAGQPSGYRSEAQPLARRRVALAAQLFVRLRAALEVKAWSRAVPLGIMWMMLRPRYAIQMSRTSGRWVRSALLRGGVGQR